MLKCEKCCISSVCVCVYLSLIAEGSLFPVEVLHISCHPAPRTHTLKPLMSMCVCVCVCVSNLGKDPRGKLREDRVQSPQ